MYLTSILCFRSIMTEKKDIVSISSVWPNTNEVVLLAPQGKISGLLLISAIDFEIIEMGSTNEVIRVYLKTLKDYQRLIYLIRKYVSTKTWGTLRNNHIKKELKHIKHQLEATEYYGQCETEGT